MFPLQDNIPSRTTPFCNYVLIALCSLIYVRQATEDPQGVTLVERYGMIPARIIHPETPVTITVDMRVVETPYGLKPFPVQREAAPPAVPAWMTLATCTFLHGGFLHLFGNMWFLLIFGDNVEDRLGHVGYALFYVLGGTIASGIHLVTDPGSTVPTVGASGAIAAVMGAYFVWYPHARVRTFIPVFIIPFFIVVPATVFLGLWFVMQLLQGFSTETGGVAWWAHIGGFGAGYLIAGALGHLSVCRPRNDERRVYEPG